MKIVLSAAAVLALAGAASAAPFQVAGTTYGNDGTSFTGVTTSTSFNTGPFGAFYGNGIVAPTGAAWSAVVASADIHTFVGARGGEAPATWASELNSPGGTSIGFGSFAAGSSAVFDFGWARGPAGLPNVNSAQADIIGLGEYVWLGRFIVSGQGSLEGDFTLLTVGTDPNGGINRYEIGQFNNETGLLAFATSDFDGQNTTYNLYVTDVPAPGAFALLGLAGLAGARRRR